MSKRRKTELVVETLAENVRTGTQEWTSALRDEMQASEFRLGERMNAYDAMLQALTEYQHEKQQELHAAINGLTTQLELLREQVETLQRQCNEARNG